MGIRTQIVTTSPSGGISQQPAHLRFPSQVEDALNAVFNVEDGFSKRRGTVFDRRITLGITAEPRIHVIDRDPDEQYLVFYDDGVLEASRIGGVDCTIDVTAAAQTYLDLNDAGADEFRLVTINDATLIVNTTVAVALTAADSYTLTRTFPEPRDVFSFSTAASNYVKAEEDDAADRAGVYQYTLSGSTSLTYGHINGPVLTDQWSQPKSNGTDARWNESAGTYNPMGFRIAVRRFSVTGFTSATYTTATRAISKTGAFAGVNWREGDMVYVTTWGSGYSNSPTAPGWFEVDHESGSNDDDTAILEATQFNTLPDADCTGVELNDGAGVCRIGREVEIGIDFSDETFDTMHDIARIIQRELRAANLENALCAWVPQAGGGGIFQITGPYRSTYSRVYQPTAPTVTGVYDMTQSGAPLNGVTETNGAGTLGTNPDTASPGTRWTRAAESAQSEAVPDDTTMPVKMERTNTERTGSITSNSAANPTVVTTSAAHGLVSGQTVTIAGQSGTVDINGDSVATVLSTTTFSVPIDCTSGGGTGGTFTGRAYFNVAVVDWNERTSGDSASNPAGKLFTTGQKIRDVKLWEDRLWLFGGQHIAGSQSGDLFNFFASNAANVVDSDPIDRTIAAEQYGSILHAVTFRESVLIFTDSGVQFDMGATGAVTPESLSITVSTRYKILDVAPQPTNTLVYFLSPRGSGAALFEYFYDDVRVAADAAEVSKHVPTLLPASIEALIVVPNSQAVYMIRNSTSVSEIYEYRSHWDGSEKVQSAWTKHDWDTSTRIVAGAALGDDVWLLTQNVRAVSAATGSPSTITETNHGLTTGNTVFFSNSTTTPSIDGSHTVTVTGANTYTIAVNVTVAGTARRHSSHFILEKLPTSRAQTPDNYDFPIHGDRQLELTGVYDGGNGWTTWTLPGSGDTQFRGTGSTINQVVLSQDFGGSSGTVLTPDAYGDDYVRVTGGDYSAGPATLCRYFNMEVELTRPYLRDGGNLPDLVNQLFIETVTVHHHSSISYSLVATQSLRATRTRSFANGTTIDERGTLFTLLSGDAEQMTLKITDETVKPATISAIAFEVEVNPIGKPVA